MGLSACKQNVTSDYNRYNPQDMSPLKEGISINTALTALTQSTRFYLIPLMSPTKDLGPSRI